MFGLAAIGVWAGCSGAANVGAVWYRKVSPGISTSGAVVVGWGAARVSKLRSVRPLAYAKTFVMTVFYWGLFKLAIPVRGFLPDRYRAEIAANSDFQKFNDGLMMTMDCTPEAVTRLKAELDRAEADGIIRHGLHVQDEALITCVVPSAFDADHMHFIDGSGGGYAAAAKQMRVDA